MSTLQNFQNEWICERCTFANKGVNLTCTMCFLTRTDAKDLPVQWEWSANPDQWIPFDLASAAELEEAYQKKKAFISPKQGYFASIPDRYEIRFNYATGRFQQHNMTSGGARRIRRVANDDNSILQPVPFENVTSEDCCIICLDNFEDETTSIEQEIVKLPPCHGHYFHRACVADDNSILQPVPFENVTSEDCCIICLDNFEDETTSIEQEIVKLPPCHGHYFHRACVAAAIKLKDECPMCKRRIDY
ncbi:hypothetical protein Glove_406g35 [Diversispora epigaea]|uniref:RING-type domain-containing protein n=1 Tax=Diversispora epigaea TaxID=1348612 RepID=A0A397GZG4_9GLOM|nr:hypothetical protein Glove_406g35 [Diversispora epigaea]